MGVIVKLQHKMNTKTILLGVFALFLAISAVSALTFSGSLTGENAVPLYNGANGTVTLADSNTSVVASLSLPNPTGALVSVVPSTVHANSLISLIVNSVIDSFKIGDQISSTLTATDVTNASNNATLPVDFVRGYCKSGDAGGNLSIDSVTISSDGADDTTWLPLDTVTVKVKVVNNGNDHIRSVIFQMGLIDASTGTNRVGDLTFSNADADKISYGTINDGDSARETFQFKVPADFNEGDYRLVIKAFSDNIKEQNECVDFSSDLDNTFYQSISVNKEDSSGKFIAFDNTQFSPNEATCGDTVTLSTDAFNVGTDDQDRVKIDLYNKELGIDTSTELLDGLNSGSSSPVSFTFDVPKNIAGGKSYKLELSAEYDYSNGLYRETSSSSTTYSYNILSCTPAVTVPGNSGAAAISATLDSDAQAGSPLVVTATVTNKLNTAASFVVDASGYDSWASLSSVSSRMVTLNPGESKDVTLNFDVNSDASGQHSFNVVVTSGNSEDSKQVVVSLAKASGFSLGSLGGNNLIWVIAAVNLVLLLIIIYVAVRLANR